MIANIDLRKVDAHLLKRDLLCPKVYSRCECSLPTLHPQSEMHECLCGTMWSTDSFGVVATVTETENIREYHDAMEMIVRTLLTTQRMMEEFVDKNV